MAANLPTKPGLLSRTVQSARSWLSTKDKSTQIHEYDYAWDGVTTAMLLGSGKRFARTRIQIYEKWHYMSGDAIVSSALRLHVTQALGGHETTGQSVFIESTAEQQGKNGDKRVNAIVEDLQKTLTPIFNRIAAPIALKGCEFGDAYGRIYSKKGVGVSDVYIDELVFPPLVQPYEQGGQTVGFVVSTGERFNERLTITQMARMKMPRMVYNAQMRVLEKAARIALKEDDPNLLPILPALVGGSFLDAAEESYDNMSFALAGLVGQRIMASIDETLLTVNYEGMTLEQRTTLKESILKMLKASKERTEKAVSEGKPLLQRFYNVLPVSGDKQVTQVSSLRGTDNSGNNITVEDVFLHARLLAGALGIDLTMLGFADQLSGGLGDGGFFRVSAQAAERSRIIRGALTDFFHQIVDVHMLQKYGFVFADGDRPYQVNFFGSISALESERQHTREAETNAALSLVSVLQQLKELGTPEEVNRLIIASILSQDEDAATLIARGLETAKAEAKKNAGGFGGFGNPDDERDPDPDQDDEDN